MRLFLIPLALAAAAPASAQVITNPVTNPNTSSPGTSVNVPRVGENVDEATGATMREQRRDARVPGPTTQRERHDNARQHEKRLKAGATARVAEGTRCLYDDRPGYYYEATARDGRWYCDQSGAAVALEADASIPR